MKILIVGSGRSTRIHCQSFDKIYVANGAIERLDTYTSSHVVHVLSNRLFNKDYSAKESKNNKYIKCLCNKNIEKALMLPSRYWINNLPGILDSLRYSCQKLHRLNALQYLCIILSRPKDFMRIITDKRQPFNLYCILMQIIGFLLYTRSLPHTLKPSTGVFCILNALLDHPTDLIYIDGISPTKDYSFYLGVKEKYSQNHAIPDSIIFKSLQSNKKVIFL